MTLCAQVMTKARAGLSTIRAVDAMASATNYKEGESRKQMLQIVTFPKFQILLFYDFDLFAVIMRHRKHLRISTKIFPYIVGKLQIGGWELNLRHF